MRQGLGKFKPIKSSGFRIVYIGESLSQTDQAVKDKHTKANPNNGALKRYVKGIRKKSAMHLLYKTKEFARAAHTEMNCQPQLKFRQLMKEISIV